MDTEKLNELRESLNKACVAIDDLVNDSENEGKMTILAATLDAAAALADEVAEELVATPEEEAEPEPEEMGDEEQTKQLRESAGLD